MKTFTISNFYFPEMQLKQSCEVADGMIALKCGHYDILEDRYIYDLRGDKRRLVACRSNGSYYGIHDAASLIGNTTGCPHYTSNVSDAISAIPDGWFLHQCGEKTRPIISAGDRHLHLAWYAEIQHRSGGRLTAHYEGETLALAVCRAVASVWEGLQSKRWHS